MSSAFPAGAYTSGDVRALWLLNEGQGQVLRDSKGNNTKGVLGSSLVTDTNDPTWVPGTIAGSSGLSFDGDDFVDIRNSPTLESNTVTLVAQVRAAGSPGAYRYVAGKGASACAMASYALYTGASGGLSFYISDGTAFTLSPDAGPAVWDGAWHTVVGTYNGTMVRLYVDGQQVGAGSPTTRAIAHNLDATVRFAVGAFRGSCNLYFRGEIDGVSVLRGAVPAAEVPSLRSLVVG